MEVELVVLVEFETRMAGGVHERGIHIDERVARGVCAIGVGQGVEVVDLRPAFDAVRRARARHKDDERGGEPCPHPFGELAEAGKNLVGRVGWRGLEVVAAAVVDDYLRRVDRHELLEAH